MSSVTLSYAHAVSSERWRCRYTIRHLCLIVLFLVTGAVVSFAQCSVGSCRTNSISFNTGVQPNTGLLYPYNSFDGTWSIISDSDPNTMEPRGAWVGTNYPAWPSRPGAQWLWRDSTNSTGGDSVLGVTVYTTEFFVCNPAGSMGNLSLSVMTPNQGRIYLNGVLLTVIASPGYPPVSYINPGVSLLSGTNVLRIEVDNFTGIAAGINIVGSLTTGGLDMLTRACGPQYITVHGAVKDDIDLSGSDVPPDPPLGGVQVQLTNPSLGIQIVNTTPTGRYWFRNTSMAGPYTIQVTPLSGYGITYGITTQTISIVAAGYATGLRTGMSSCAQVCVGKYNDLNCNGHLDPGEPSLAGWTFLFSDGQVVTSATGILICRKVCGLSSLTVTEVIPPGSCWKNTQPGTGSYTINPIPGQSFNLYFGNSSTGTLCITKFNDLNEDGIQQPTDPLLPGWEFTVTSPTYSGTVTTGPGGTVCIPVTCGTYTVTETMQPGWHNTTPLSRSIVVEACNTTTATFGNASTGTICIKKFHDLNCDGVYNSPDTLLPNWTFTINNGGTPIVVNTGVTGITCANVTAGTWTICEILQPGWSVTTPGGLCQTVVVTPGGPTAELYFGNASTGTVCGFKYNDVNNNGTYDPFPGPDVPMSGWTIRLYDSNPTLIASGITDANGLYCFENLLTGTYYMDEVQQAGWTQTEPAPPFTTYQVEVTPCCYTIFTFGNHQVQCTTAICITKFNDFNCNGHQDGTEPVLPDWTFVITNAVSGQTIYVTTGTNGVTCANVTAGTWKVCEVQQAGWVVTTPECVFVTIATCQTISVEFGNSSTGTVCGFKYNDVNNNGTYDPFPGPDVPMSGWTINLYDDTFTLIASGVTGTNGLYCFETLLSGDYYMQEVQQGGWNQTEPAPPFTTYQVEVTPCCYTIFTFGNHQVQCTTAICITKFNDINCNGAQDPGELPLPGWVFNLTNGIVNIQVTTNSLGVTCANVTAGNWTVCEVLPATCWKPTTPGGSCQMVTVSSCSTRSLLFGNSSTGTLCVTKFNDLNGDGKWTPGEPPIAGWQFNVSGVGTVTTGTNGTVCIPVTCGTYTVCEVLLLGWAPTTPTCATVTVDACGSTSATFGNKLVTCTTQICTVKYNDKNCDGIYNSGDELMPGWTIVISLPGGGPVVATGVTGSDGSVCIPVTAGTYEVREVIPAVVPPACGWVQTYPAGGGFHTVTVTTCATKTVEFGNSSTGTLCIRKFNDVNCNGIWDAGEQGISGWRFTLTLGLKQMGVVTGAGGTVCVPVTCGTWTVCEQKLSCWVPTTQPGLCQTIFVQACGPATTATFGNSSTGTLCISKFNDLNGDGKWTPGEPGLPWTFVVSGVGTVVTGTSGTVCIPVVCGTYNICEVTQAGWTPTTPICTTVTVTPCTTVSVTFGNKQTTTCTAMICGKKYWERPHNGQNCNGVIDPDEVGMWGYTIIIEDAMTGTVVTTGTTATDGSYCLTVPGPGTYRVKEVQKWGFQQTWPPTPPGFYTLVVAQCGQVIQNVNFLNCACPNDPCVTDSIPIQSRPGAFNGRTVLVVDPSGGFVPRLGVALPGGVPNPFLPPVGTSQWIGPNPCVFPPCNDPVGTYIWRRYFCLCSGIDSTIVRVRLCFEGVNRVQVFLSGKLLGTYVFPNAAPTCIDTLVAVGGNPCPYLEFRVTRLAGTPANPAALSYQGSIVGPGLVKDSCCNCYLNNGGGVVGGGTLIAPDEDHSNIGTPGDDQADAGHATTNIYGLEGNDADPLLKSVPNPTSGETTVSYLLSHSGEVRLDLYNSVGRHISTLEQGYRDAGMHNLPVDLTDLPSGFYHVRLSINGRVYTLKIMSNK